MVKIKKIEAEKLSWLELLDQDKWWRTNDGICIKLVNMSSEHRMNTLAMLRRKSPAMALENERRILGSYLLFGPDPSDGVFWAAESWMVEAQHALDDPLSWMMAKPLCVKLKELIAQDLELVNM